MIVMMTFILVSFYFPGPDLRGSNATWTVSSFPNIGWPINMTEREIGRSSACLASGALSLLQSVSITDTETRNVSHIARSNNILLDTKKHRSDDNM